MAHLVERMARKNSKLPKVHFACKPNCAACCDGPPAMSICEAMALYEDFALEGLLSVFVATNPQGNEGRELADQFQSRVEGGMEFNIIGERHPGLSYAFTLTARSMDLHVNGKCHQVTKTNRCAIYDRRPQICRTVPICSTISESRNHQDIVDEFQARLPCDWSTNAPLLLDKGMIVNTQIKADYCKALKNQAHDELLIRSLFDHATLLSLAHHALSTKEQIVEIPVDYSHILMAAHKIFMNAARKNETERYDDDKFWLNVKIPKIVAYADAQMARLNAIVESAMNYPHQVPDHDPTVMIRAINYHAKLVGLRDLAHRELSHIA